MIHEVAEPHMIKIRSPLRVPRRFQKSSNATRKSDLFVANHGISFSPFISKFRHYIWGIFVFLLIFPRYRIIILTKHKKEGSDSVISQSINPCSRRIYSPRSSVSIYQLQRKHIAAQETNQTSRSIPMSRY